MAGSDSSNSEGLSNQQRSLLTLALLIHFVCVGTVLASNLRRSELLAKLVGIFGVYTQTLHFDPNFIPYHYGTRYAGIREGDDCFFEVEVYPSAEQPPQDQSLAALVTLPQEESRYGEERRRIFALARTMASNLPSGRDAFPEEEVAAAAAARGVVQSVLAEKQGKRAVVRLIRRESQPLDLADLNETLPPEDPTAPEYQTELFVADAWVTEDGEIELVKRAISASQVAPLKGIPSMLPGGKGAKAAAETAEAEAAKADSEAPAGAGSPLPPQ
ncbi:MAG: hypothetical protein U0894_16125 [Pirellulales bacterium]